VFHHDLHDLQRDEQREMDLGVHLFADRPGVCFVLFYDAGLSVVDGLSTASKRVHISPFFAFLKMVYHKSVNDPLNKKIFCLGAVFLIFSKKKSKKGAQTSFYFAAGGGEILFAQPRNSYENK
jgi:hypothetical protein